MIIYNIKIYSTVNLIKHIYNTEKKIFDFFYIAISIPCLGIILSNLIRSCALLLASKNNVIFLIHVSSPSCIPCSFLLLFLVISLNLVKPDFV